MSSTAPPADILNACRQRYLANLAALYQADTPLARQLEAIPFSQTPPLEAARDGNFTVQLLADNGKPVYAHSRYRPLEEAAALIDRQTRKKPPATDAPPAETPEADDESVDDDLENPSFFVSGLGLGYAVIALEERFTRPLVIVAEDDLGLIKAAMCVCDFSTMLAERRMTFLASADKATVHANLRAALIHLMLGIKFITMPHTARYHASFHSEITGLLRDFVSYSRVQVMSLLRHARATCRNVAFNLATYVRQPGVEIFRNRAKRYPAILVAAGPSLARNLDQLSALKDRAVIIAVQTVLKTLLARGAPPHFVTSLDFHEISAQFFRDIDDFADTILVAEPKATHAVIDTFCGRTHLLRSEFADDILQDAAPQRDALSAGSTVAHLAYYFAEHLGCDPIILVGQDLSFSEGLYYPPGMQIERIWAPELGRFNTIETKQWERIVRHRRGLRKVTDVHGRQTYTDDQLFTYAEQFQSDFLTTPTRIIHAGEGGMRLAGTEIMTLRDAVERYCQRPLPADLFAAPEERPSPDLHRRVTGAIEKRLAELSETREIALQTIAVLKRLVDLVEQPAEFNRLVQDVDELRSRMKRYDKMYNLIVQVSQHAELRRLQADRAIHDDAPETPATARRRLKRDREYVEALLDGCDFLQQTLEQALQRVHERLK
jgi:hypothetical protein